MINSVTLKNFRGFSDTTVPLSQVTMLTGTNGVGKTSVLEGLYCLFSETRLDVSFLERYKRTVEIVHLNHFNGMQSFPVLHPTYNYRLFWQECPMNSEETCCISATDDKIIWKWTYKKTNTSDIDKRLFRDFDLMNVPASIDVALFNWQHQEASTDKKTNARNSNNFDRAQILNPDGVLRLISPQKINLKWSICRYIDFASIRAMPQKLPHQTAKRLTKELKTINPRITDVRISNIENGLSVILDDNIETTLATIGNGAVAWASVLISIFELNEQCKNIPETNMPILILIDEIGAGIHYSIMNDLWKYIRDFVEEYPNIQFVTTSHSDDCVLSFCEVFENTDAASVVRLHKTYDNEIITTLYDKSNFETIMSGEWEVRG